MSSRPEDLDLFAAAPDGVVVTDETGAILRVNQVACEMFGYRDAELVGQPLEVLMPERFRTQHVHHRDAFVQHPGRRPMGLALTLFGRRHDGEEFPVDISLSHQRTDAGLLVVAFVRDVTARRQMEAGLRASSEQLRLATERERIARDLHDTVIQRLFAVGLSLEGARRRPPEEVEQRLQQAVSDIDDTIRAIRSVIFSLEARTDDTSGLRAAVLDVITDCVAALGFEPALRFDGPVDTLASPAITENVVAVLREALANVARHAQATSAIVTVSAGDELVLCVDDDGVGDDTFHRAEGHGVANFVERARALGGDASVSRRDPHGTRVEWRVPTSAR